MPTPLHQVLTTLPKNRITELGRDAGLAAHGRTKAELIDSLLKAQSLSFRRVLTQLRRDELRGACRAVGVDDGGRARQELMARLIAHATPAGQPLESQPPPPLFSGAPVSRHVPKVSDTVIARHRQWLVTDVVPPPNPGDATLVALTCLDDDHRGQTLQLLWELELGAKVIPADRGNLGDIERLDEPRHFAAYLHALRWQAVTASERDFFQAPFRAGVEILDHQLTPLQKALSLPRANLFIADDVGLGKTIEAGLVLQELLLRQRVEMAVIVCPASITSQWQREMDQRFGLHFEIYSRDFVLACRRERGFGVNPWTTHPRFIISYPLLRRPEYRDGLVMLLDERSQRDGDSAAGLRARKSMLILDEAHTAAPSSGGRYAIDSQTTRVVRDIAPRFENRLFLSATPHNGHSNSFSALLEILDPQRFARGVPVSGPDQLEPIMTRRLKKDLRALGKSMRFPERKVIRIGLQKTEGDWTATFANNLPLSLPSSVPETTPSTPETTEPGTGMGTDTGKPEQFVYDELALASDLAAYTALFAEQPKSRRLALINLQKRLLSSVEAFARTLRVHRQTKAKATAALEADQLEAAAEPDDDTTLGFSDEDLDAAEDLATTASSAALHAIMPPGAADLLTRMHQGATRLRSARCAKTEALLQWIRRELCPGLAEGAPLSDARRWQGKRVIVFTEYMDTLKHLRRVLLAELGEHFEDRVIELRGGMGEDDRSEVQAEFNADPNEEPCRILLATDAAREGLNLQAHCEDLFHFDIPWNPSRMEQRNGRIDRALQPAEQVRCHYFVYEDRVEDRVLDKLVQKTALIQEELGSLGDVVAERIQRSLSSGIGADTAEQLDLAASADAAGDDSTAELRALNTTRQELESIRRQEVLSQQLSRARQVYERSRQRLQFEGDHLRDALDVGLELAGVHAPGATLQPAESNPTGAFQLPTGFGPAWQRTLDPLRPPRKRDEDFFEWRDKSPRPVVFEAPKVLSQAAVHLHLEHPFVKRVLSRFLAQGFSTHDLSRVTAVPIKGRYTALALGRLCLFGAGAGRLHDTLLCAAADIEGVIDGHGTPVVLDHDQSLQELARLERHLQSARPSLDRLGPALQSKLVQRAPHLLESLLPALRAEADSEAVEVEQRLKARGIEERDQLLQLLQTQRSAIEEALGGTQLRLDFGSEPSPAELRQQEQLKRDRAHLEKRLTLLDQEMASEPADLEALYEVKLRRFEPIGLVYLVPETSL